MKTADFDFELPSELVALRPAFRRDKSRLLVLHKNGDIEHRLFSDIVEYLGSGDMLLLNDTKVLPVRLIGYKPTGGKVDLILIRESGDGVWEILCRGRYKGRVSFRSGVSGEIFFDENARGSSPSKYLRFTCPETGDIKSILEICGSMPLPPYIKRDPDEDDIDRYQTIYAERPGSIAAPTAGLHFTFELLNSIAAAGVKIRKITLHVGPGTFTPVTVDDVEDHKMSAEYFEAPLSLKDEIVSTKASGGRVITVGTTATRAIEGFMGGAFKSCGDSGDGIVKGYTEIFIYPGYRFITPDALLTNFHLPKSTPLMLAAAFCGLDNLMRAYHEAVSKGYRFFSYGDAMLIL